MARVLAREADDEARVVAEIAPPQSPGLLDQPEGPLEAEALERLRGLALEAGVEVERRADPDEHGSLEPPPHGEHELLLQRDAESDPDHVGLGRVELGGDGVGLLGGELAERARPGADDAQAGIAPRQLLTQRRERGLAPAVEVEGLA